MASTYTTSFGIEKIGTGDQAGTWGATTNHNLDIRDRVASYTTVALSGTTHTLTVRDASPGSGTENLQDGMYRVVKFTGALGGNNTVTIAPNTSKAYFIIINGTTDSGSSGPYSVILSQGSGANVTVENGKSAIVHCDGAGSGAAVADALSNLQLATLTASGDVTSSGTLNALGDTAASDKAAVGYTASEALILTGQGSTNDVTIKNDADADVITIATGATNVDVVGDLTAATLNADGDTSAGDNATIGYTAAEGLILTGQGSTSDITVKNDADADVLTIATGTTTVDFKGGIGVTGTTTTEYLTATSSMTSPGVYSNTTGSGANVVVDSAGGFARSTSSRRYKNSIEDAAHGLSEVMALRPVTFKHQHNGDVIFGGLIAEEVHDAGLSEFVEYSLDDAGEPRPESLFYGPMVSLSLKAIQELKAELDAEKAKVSDLLSRVTALESGG